VDVLEGKGTYVIRERKRRAGLDDALFARPVITTSKSSDHLAKSVKISRGRSLPSLNTEKSFENGIIVPIDLGSGEDVFVQKKEVEENLLTSSVEMENSVIMVNHVDCNGCLDSNTEDLSQESAIVKVKSSPKVEKDIISVNSNQVDACAMISTENQNQLLEDKVVLVNGNSNGGYEENLEPVANEWVAAKTEIVQDEEEIPVVTLRKEEIPVVEFKREEIPLVEVEKEETPVRELKKEETTVVEEKISFVELKKEEIPVVELENKDEFPVDEVKSEQISFVEEKSKEEPLLILDESIPEVKQVKEDLSKEEIMVDVAEEISEEPEQQQEEEKVEVPAKVFAKVEDAVEAESSTDLQVEAQAAVEPEEKIDAGEVSAPPLSEILDSGSEESDEENNEPLGPCEMSFKIMRPKVNLKKINSL